MKNKLAVLFFSMVLVTFTACMKEPEKTGPDESFQIDCLFTHDGITVYRFTDDGRYIYFVNKSKTVDKEEGIDKNE